MAILVSFDPTEKYGLDRLAFQRRIDFRQYSVREVLWPKNGTEEGLWPLIVQHEVWTFGFRLISHPGISN